ncbi:ATP-binding protein [Streptomyces sp. NPDC048106]|uniref:ATP-binding protein n=1 Tax=Streptomyces sp. NPDC048106 TaxID=3155750 RepID=UPI003453D939
MSAPTPLRPFSVPLSATRRGARLARFLAVEQLESWGVPLDPARVIVAELATNTVLHGRVPGRSFRLTLAVPAPGVLRIEVTDTRAEALPVRGSATVQDGVGGVRVRSVPGVGGQAGVSGPAGSGALWARR